MSDTPREDAIEALLRVLDEWTGFYGPIEGDAGHPEKYMTQLDHGSEEYEVRIAVVECARAVLGAEAETPPGPINDHERDCPDCQRVIAEERASWVDLASPETAEALARALERTGHCGDDHQATLGPMDPSEHDDPGCLFRPESMKDAAAILAAMRERLR